MARPEALFAEGLVGTITEGIEVTITLTPDTEARLRARAEREQLDVNALAEALLVDALINDPDDLNGNTSLRFARGSSAG